MREVRLLPEAEREMMEAAEWYEERRAGVGERFLLAIEAVLFEVANHPSIGRRISQRADLHRIRVRRFPYSIVYEAGDAITVLAVAHHRRRADYWRRRAT